MIRKAIIVMLTFGWPGVSGGSFSGCSSEGVRIDIHEKGLPLDEPGGSPDESRERLTSSTRVRLSCGLAGK